MPVEEEDVINVVIDGMVVCDATVLKRAPFWFDRKKYEGQNHFLVDLHKEALHEE